MTGTETTRLTVVVVDGYHWYLESAGPNRDDPLTGPGGERGLQVNLDTSCDGVLPHRLEVLLDGEVVGAAGVRCDEVGRVPRPRVSLPSFDVPAGTHRIRIREVESGVSAARDYVFPEMAFGAIADVLLVNASEHELLLDDLRSGPLIWF